MPVHGITLKAQKPTDIVIIEGVPICATGIEYPLASGPRTFTEDDLKDAVAAAENDPTLQRPRTKVGHVEGSWQAGGEPSIGNFFNLRLSEDGQEILADWETFRWLAEAAPVVYPSRSIEADVNVQAASGRSYRVVINAVALLGVELPGVGSLDDLRDVITNPEVTVLEQEGRVLVASSLKAQVDVDDVRRAFFEVVATDERYWWWPRSIKLGPNEVICQDEESGELFSVPFDIKNRKVEFGEPVAVYEVYKAKPKGEQPQTAEAARVGTWITAASSREGYREETMMDPKELRAQLGLADDATEQQVRERIESLTAAAEQGPEDPPAEGGEEGSEEQGSEEKQETAEQPAQEAVAASRGTITLEASAFEQLKQDAVMGRQAREEQIKAARESFVDSAIKAGKIPPARREHWLSLMAADDKGTRETIESLAEGVVPVGQLSDSREEEAQLTAAQSGPALPLTMYTPAELARMERHGVIKSKG